MKKGARLIRRVEEAGTALHKGQYNRLRLEPRASSRTIRQCVVVLLGSVCVAACEDNATRLSTQLDRAASTLSARGSGAVATVRYEPMADAPYTLIFFPVGSTTMNDLVAAGVPTAAADRIRSELAYLGTTDNLLVVDQDGQRLTFTSAWRRAAQVQGLVVSPRKTGASQVVLRRDNQVNWVVAVE